VYVKIWLWLSRVWCIVFDVLWFCVWQCPVEEYERSWEQNEELGLNDMDTSSAEVGSKTEWTSCDFLSSHSQPKQMEVLMW